MTVSLTESGVIQLTGFCELAEAETLLQMLSAQAEPVTVDWRMCENAHTAVIQVLLAVRPILIGPPASTFLTTYIAGLLS
jgi:hypothetical protein